MLVAIQHNISNPQKWQESVKKIQAAIDGGTLPQGVKPLSFLPGVNGRNAHCLWETDSVETLKKYIDGETAAFARNDYFQVDTNAAMGLPAEALATH